MPRKPSVPGLRLPLRRSITPVLLLAVTAVGAAHAAGEQPQVTEQMRADCRAEGEAGGLQGAELDAYVRECIADLLTVEISNIEE